MAIYPGVSAKSASEEIEQVVREFSASDPMLKSMAPTITWNGFFAEGYVLEPGSEAEKALGRAHLHATGDELKTHMSGAYLDARIHTLYDKIPAMSYGPISGSIHGSDEWVSVSSVKRVTMAIALFIAEWCGVEKIA